MTRIGLVTLVIGALIASRALRAEAVFRPPVVRIGSPSTVATPGAGGGNFVERLGDGSLLTNVKPDGKSTLLYLSGDDGQTWKARATYQRGAIPLYPIALRDGTILGFEVFPNKQVAGQQTGLYKSWRGHDTLTTLQQTTSHIDVPEAVSGTGDAIDWANPIEGMVFYSPNVVEFSDGRLLATMYGWLGSRLVPMTDLAYIAGARKLKTRVPNQYCSIVIESSDRGKTWKHLSTISQEVKPVDPVGNPIGTEGPCEPTMAYTHDGDLIAIMRTGRRAPMFQARSTNDGRSWQKAQQMDVYGVAPNLMTMQNGTLACAYGTKNDWRRPREIHVMFSFDGGRTWPVNTLVYKGDNVGSYPGLCELRPGVLLVSYAPHPAAGIPRQVTTVTLVLE